MKRFSFLVLLAVLFVSDYAFAQGCPCDTTELSNGTTGNDIVELLCPGGSLSGDAFFELSENFVFIVSDDDTMGYEVEIFPEVGVCTIGQEGSGDPNNEVARKLTLEQAANCRASLIERCRLNSTPIPTLSEWGLIAMAGVLGIIGLLVAVRRRKAAV